MDRAGIDDFVSKLANSASELPAKSFDSSRPESKVFSNFATQTAGKSFDSSRQAESKVAGPKLPYQCLQKILTFRI